jgi:hypothetical protein
MLFPLEIINTPDFSFAEKLKQLEQIELLGDNIFSSIED